MHIEDRGSDDAKVSLRSAKEYGVIEVFPEEVMTPEGKLLIYEKLIDKYVKVDFKWGKIRVSAKGVSGVFPLTERITVQVRPRFPVRNLSHMVSACGYEPAVLESLRQYSSAERYEDWMLNVLTDAYLVAMERIAEQGFLRTYDQRSIGGSYPHGRIKMSETVNKFASRGVFHRAEYSWFEKSMDNVVNQCLRAACVHLYLRHRNSALNSDSRVRSSRLNNILSLLEEVTDVPEGEFIYDPVVRGVLMLPDARSYYRQALDLSLAILESSGFDIDAWQGNLQAGSLLIKTEDLFEDFVRLSLQQEFARHERIDVLDGNAEGQLPLFEPIEHAPTGSNWPKYLTVKGPSRAATPDIVFRNIVDHDVPLVADAKFTSVVDHAGRSELEQVVTYGARYQSPIAMTIHPRKSNTTGGLVFSGRIGNVLVAQYRVDLGAENLDSEMADMANAIAELIESAY